MNAILICECHSQILNFATISKGLSAVFTDVKEIKMGRFSLGNAV
jgi:hypothetical protein